MAVQHNNYNPYIYQSAPPMQTLVSQIGKQTLLPDNTRNYCQFNQNLVQQIVAKREQAVPVVLNFLKSANDEKQITEGLYILDRMIDAKVKGVDGSIYPTISRFNNTTSPNIQTMLAGIYRKTQVPDGFGPLCRMLINDSLQPNSPYFDPTEEVGGAILEYIRNYGAENTYKQMTQELKPVLNANTNAPINANKLSTNA